MANPGNGFRNVNSLMMEISLHLVEQIVNTAVISGPITAGLQTVTLALAEYIYVGAQLLVTQSDGTQPSAITVASVNPGAHTITANFTSSYFADAIIQGATFPSQHPTDPLFTQSEILGYIARAQNEFLSRVPIIFQFLSGYMIQPGTLNQTVPGNAIELERVAILTGEYQGADQGEGPYGGGAIPVRLYEVSQQQVAMRDPNWQNNTSNPTPTVWYEDRQGAYGWGVAGIPQAEFPTELIYSIRDDEILLISDGFLVPDAFLHFVKYRVLMYVWQKTGEQQWPTGARMMGKRFDRGVMITDRYLRSFIQAPAEN